MTYSIGREETNDIVVADPKVSAVHAFIDIVDVNTIVIKDNQTKNGSWVDNRKIKSASVSLDSIVRFGDSESKMTDLLKLSNGIIIGVKDKLDFTDYFLKLESIEESFERQIELGAKSSSTWQILFKLCAAFMTITGLLRFVFMNDIKNNPGLGYVFVGLLGFFALFSVVAYIVSLRFSKAKDKERKKMKDNYKLDFSCPNCKNFIPDSTYIMKAREEYTCRYCKALLYKQ